MSKRFKVHHNTAKGFLIVPLPVITSPAYSALMPMSRLLMVYLQMHWKIDKPVSYGVREAAKKLNCTANTACKLFNDLHEKGFIRLNEESIFNIWKGSKPREWRLTWCPYGNGNFPTDEWKGYGKNDEVKNGKN